MPPVTDASVEQGRVDVVDPQRPPVDGYLFVQTQCHGVESLAAELGRGVQRTYGLTNPVNLHVRVYHSDRDTAVIVVTETGWTKWAERGAAAESGALETHLSNTLVCEYSTAVLAQCGKVTCSHETCFANGNSIYWMGA